MNTQQVNIMKKKAIGVLAIVSLCLMSAACGGKKENGTGLGDSTVSRVSEAPAESGKIYSDSIPTVVDFYAVWCGPCRMIAPLVAEMEEEYAGKINFVSVDVDREPALAAKYGIQAMPTFLFLAPGGKETGRIVGADKEALTAKVKEMAGE